MQYTVKTNQQQHPRVWTTGCELIVNAAGLWRQAGL